MGASVLPFSGRHTIPSVLNLDIMNVSELLLLLWLLGIWISLALKQVLRLVEVVLSAHTTRGLVASDGPPPIELSASCWSATIGSWGVAKVVKVVEHEVHVLLFLTLEVVDDPLILVHLDSDVSISLPRDGPRFDESSANLLILLVHVVVALSCGHLVSGSELFLATTHGLVVQVSALLLQLVVTYIESVAANGIVSHSPIKPVIVGCVIHSVLEDSLLLWVRFDGVKATISITVTVGSVIVVNVVWHHLVSVTFASLFLHMVCSYCPILLFIVVKLLLLVHLQIGVILIVVQGGVLAVGYLSALQRATLVLRLRSLILLGSIIKVTRSSCKFLDIYLFLILWFLFPILIIS